MLQECMHWVRERLAECAEFCKAALPAYRTHPSLSFLLWFPFPHTALSCLKIAQPAEASAELCSPRWSASRCSCAHWRVEDAAAHLLVCISVTQEGKVTITPWLLARLFLSGWQHHTLALQHLLSFFFAVLGVKHLYLSPHFFGDWDSCNQSGLKTHSAAKNDLELLILLSRLPQCWDYMLIAYLDYAVLGLNWRLSAARQALYHQWDGFPNINCLFPFTYFETTSPCSPEWPCIYKGVHYHNQPLITLNKTKHFKV